MGWSELADIALRATINTFKTPGSYVRAADPDQPISIKGVFHLPSADVDPQTGASVTSVAPAYGIRLADLVDEEGNVVAAAAGDLIVIKGTRYRVLAVQEDGEGGAELPLGEE